MNTDSSICHLDLLYSDTLILLVYTVSKRDTVWAQVRPLCAMDVEKAIAKVKPAAMFMAELAERQAEE